MVAEALDAAWFAAVRGNQIRERGVPADPGRMPAERRQFALGFRSDIRADLVGHMLRDAHMRVVDEHLGRGFAQLPPCVAHRVGDLVEIHVVTLAEIRHDVRMGVQPGHDGADIVRVERLALVISRVIEAILAVERDDAVEMHRDRIQHDLHMRRGTPRADEHADAAMLKRMQRVDGRLWHDMRDETGQRAVDVEECGFHTRRRLGG